MYIGIESICQPLHWLSFVAERLENTHIGGQGYGLETRGTEQMKDRSGPLIQSEQQ